MKAFPALATGLTMLVAVTGCQKEEISTYRVAKETVQAAPSAAAPAAAGAAWTVSLATR